MEALKNGGNIIGAGGAGGDWESIFENDQSDKVRDPEKMALLWKYSNEVCASVQHLSPHHQILSAMLANLIYYVVHCVKNINRDIPHVGTDVAAIFINLTLVTALTRRSVNFISATSILFPLPSSPSTFHSARSLELNGPP